MEEESATRKERKGVFGREDLSVFKVQAGSSYEMQVRTFKVVSEEITFFHF